MATETFNQAHLDALVRHQIGLLRLSGSVRDEIHLLLDATEEDLRDTIRRRLSGLSDTRTPAGVRRLQRLLDDLQAIRARAWREIDALWVRRALELAREEPRIAQGIFRTAVPSTIETSLPAVELLTSIVRSEPFHGRVLRDWAADVERADLDRILSQVRIGMALGEGSSAISRRVVGSVRQRGRDGVTQVARRDAATITRTMVNHIGNRARQEFYRANAALFPEELYVATLDSLTTPVCRSLDGRRYAVGEGPVPPLHMNCRSLRVPVIDGRVIGTRPARGDTQSQLLREYTSARGLQRVRRRADLPHGHRGAFDDFSSTRMRELTGTVPARVTYNEWLQRQSASFQDDVLGRTRGRLFRRGGLSLDRHVNRAGDQIPLSRLARTDREAFIAAGLDPEDFL